MLENVNADADADSVPMENPPDCALLKEAGHHAASASEEEAPQQKLIVCTYVWKDFPSF